MMNLTWIVAIFFPVFAHAEVDALAERTIDRMVQQSHLSPTRADFVRAMVTSPEQRAEIETYLKSAEAWDTKMPNFERAGETSLVFNSVPGPAIVASFSSQPKPTMKIGSRVISLGDRTAADVSKDIEDAIRSYLFTSVWGELLAPRANAFGDTKNDITVGAWAFRGSVHATGPVKPGAIKPTAEEEIAAAKGKFKSFSCEKIDGKPRVNVSRGTNFGENFRVENIESAKTFSLSRIYDSGMSQKCTFKVVNGAIELSKTSTCNQQAAQTDKYYQSKTKKEKPKKGAPVEPPAPKFGLESLLPGVPVAAMITCCQADPKCPQKIANEKTAEAGASSGARPASK